MGIGDEAGMKTVQYVERILPEILGAKDVATLVDGAVSRSVRELDQLLEKHAAEVDRRALALGRELLSEARRNFAETLELEVTSIVRQTRHEAESLVSASFDRTEKTVARVVGELSTAISRQHTEVKISASDIVNQAGMQIEPLSRRLLWVGIFIGIANFAGIVVGSLLAR